MGILRELEWRGLLNDISDREGVERLSAGTSFYVGIDPSAPSLQLGNLVPLMVSIHLARAGLVPIILFGGATGAIGDPSGKRSERPLLSREQIVAHIARHREKASEIFERAGVSARFVDNFEWTANVSIIDFLREVGKHFTINYMLAKEHVRTRLEGDGISYAEFSYMLLQSFDFLHLFEQHGCKLQIGGSDQWGNITAGLELIRRRTQGEAFALSFPLVLDAQGRKFGKSESGALWLHGDVLSPYKFHQFWLNLEDRDVIRMLKIFTFLGEREIRGFEESLSAQPEKREAQRALADAVCTLIHGEDATQEAKRCAQVLFGGSFEGVPEAALLEIFSDAPSSNMGIQMLEQQTVAELFAHVGLVPSKSEARRLIQSGGAYLNNTRVHDPAQKLSGSSHHTGSFLVLRSGKKNYHVLRLDH